MGVQERPSRATADMLSLREVLEWASKNPKIQPRELKCPIEGTPDALEASVALGVRRFRARAAKGELHKYDPYEVAQLNEVGPVK
jgi:hypothetical protein